MRHDWTDFDPFVEDDIERAEAEQAERAERIPFDGPDDPAALEPIVDGCAWLRHCRDDAEVLHEPEWYAMLNVLARVVDEGGTDGTDIAHTWSRPHPGYKAKETDAKLARALTAGGPLKCTSVADRFGATWCEACEHRGKIHGPIVLGRKDEARPVVGSSVVRHPSARADGDDEEADDRPFVELCYVERHRTMDGVARVLAKRDPKLFDRGGLPVFVNTRTFPPRLDVANSDVMADRIGRYVRLWIWTKGGDRARKPPPDWLSRRLANVSGIPLRSLAGITTYPILRPDGSVLGTKGYDKETAVLYLPDVDFDPVPDTPTDTEVADALGALDEVIVDFPFANDGHRSAWFALLLGMLGRYAYPGWSPLVMADASMPGSGKGLLLDAACAIASGRPLAKYPWPAHAEEQTKLLVSLLMAGDPVVCFDNVKGKFGGPSVESIVTAEYAGGRVLGGSRTITVENRTMWTMTANNATLTSDVVRRVIPIRLTPHTERPYLRSDFRHPNLLGWVRENRPRLAPAALTLLRAYHVAGRPVPEWPAHAAVGWSTLVRGALHWLGLEDPLSTIAAMEVEADDEKESLAQVIRALNAHLIRESADALSAKEITHAFTAAEPTVESRSLRHALMDAMELRSFDDMSARRVGCYLRDQRGRIVDGQEIFRYGASGRATTWAVRSVAEA